MKFSLIGMNGCGKSTIAEHLTAVYHTSLISAGYYIRNADRYPWVSKHLPDGYDVYSGELLPNENLVAIFAEAVGYFGKQGFIFDGSPRRIGQARTFIESPRLCPSHFIYINTTSEIISERLSHRRYHSGTVPVYLLRNSHA